MKEMALPIGKHRETCWALSPDPADVFMWLLDHQMLLQETKDPLSPSGAQGMAGFENGPF